MWCAEAGSPSTESASSGANSAIFKSQFVGPEFLCTCDRETEGEYGTVVWLTGHAESAVMRLHDRTTDCQAHPRTLRTGSFIVRAIEPVEDETLFCRINPYAAIGDACQHHAVLLFGRN